MPLPAPNPLPPSLNPLPVVRVLDLPVHVLSKQQTVAECARLIETQQAQLAITVNALLALQIEKDEPLKQICEKAALCIPDSIGIVWATKKLTTAKPPLYPGIELAEDLCALCEMKAWPVYFLGGAPGVAGQAARIISQKFPYLQISGQRDGFFQPSDEKAIFADIGRSGSRLVLVALGSPRQEKWINEHLHELPPALYIGVGGTFDVWSGKLKRAPQFFRARGLEWMYRLIQEPTRANRMAQLPAFALKVLRQSFRGN
jgi:N-acetylglucosaminyldiphosphoundecaprenol N-acetyl-beta-D-mannosaminyltransferase